MVENNNSAAAAGNSDKLQNQPTFRRLMDNNSNIFDDICNLQKLIQMESELKQTFFIRFDDMI